ncbi:MAG: TolC family protein [Rhodanobacteraceae bacterium]|nr:TolC family protein [Rhodanobacteraceae bacterium]
MNAMRPLVCVLLLMTSGCMARRELAPIDELTLSVDATAVTAAALDEPLTAARALQIALAQNPEVRAALARLDAVEAERVQAGLLRNPMLSLMAMRPDGGGRLAVTASWMQSQFDLLTRSRRVALADADARRARADVALRLLDVGWQAQTAFHEAVAAIARVRLLQSELALDTQALDLQTRWAQRGPSSQADVLRLQAMRDERLHMRHQAEVDAVRAQSLLAQRLGLDSPHSLRLPDDVERPELPSGVLADWQSRALAERPELKASAAAIEVVTRTHAIETGPLRASEPELGITLERATDGMTMVGPELRIALPWFDRGQARDMRLDAMHREATWRDEAQRRQVLLEVERALSVLIHAVHTVEDSEQHLSRAQMADALAAREQRSGNIGLMARIAAQRDVLAAERQHLDACSELAQMQVELQRAVGSPGAGG